MGRIAKIENIVAGTLPPHNQLKLIPRRRPTFLDAALEGGFSRFIQKRGAQFAAMLPDNVGYLASDAYKDSATVYLSSRPAWIGQNCLIRLGETENIGELHTVRDLIDPNGIELNDLIIANHSAVSISGIQTGVFLIGTPVTVYAASFLPKESILVRSWYPIVPHDSIVCSATPDVLPSLNDWVVREAIPMGTATGGTGEPAVVYLYEIRLETQTGQLPFVPDVGSSMYLKAQPLYFRNDFREVGGDITLPSDVGPFLVDAFYGSLLDGIRTSTWLGLKKWDSFGTQLNASVSKWDVVKSNYMIYERPIKSDSLMFWQRITGNFQFQKQGYFQAELNSDGEFIMSSDLLVPPFPTDVSSSYGWVIPIFSRSEIKIVTQWEPQQQQIFTVPGNTLSFIRPRIYPVVNVTVANTSLVAENTTTIPAIAGDTISIAGQKLTCVTDDPEIHQFKKGRDGTVTATNLAALINSETSIAPYASAVASGTVVTITFLNNVQIETSNPGGLAISGGAPIQRMLFSIKGSPSTRVEIRDWEYDGQIVSSLSYFILGTGAPWGEERWMGGGFSIKPLFYTLDTLRARYSDGASRYNAGYIYS